MAMGIWEITLAAGAVILCDLMTKAIALRRLATCNHSRGVLRLVINGQPLLARRTSRPNLVVLWIAATFFAVSALAFSPSLRANSIASAGVVVALAGASSNLVDRLARGAIIDFIAIGRWPVFNLADLAIVAGAAATAASLL